ncbi:MAG: prolyl oligopeptidase family serine peptidase [Bacteroidota bacterium]|nr:prolyl oligopeptidase family serine peptidase [Bacteroidota bacterium]
MKTTVTSLIILLCSSTSFAQWNYPVTKVVDSSETYFGVNYKDPYRWLENFKDSAVVTWFKDEANLSNSILNKISGRDELIVEWKMLDKLQPPAIHGRDYENGRIFYRKTMPGENVAKIYYRQGMDGKEILLFDPTTYINGKTLSVQSAMPSYDGKKIIIGYSEGGAEVSTIKVMDVDTKTFLPETIYPSWFGPISWTFDNNSFTYFSQKTADNTSRDFELNTKSKLHKLGTDVKNDIDFFSNESYPGMDIKPNDLPFASVNKDSKNYIFASLANVRQEYFMYYAPIAQFNEKKIQWKVLCKPEDKLVRGMEFIDDKVFAITYNDAKNYKLISTDLKNPDWQHAKTISEEKNNQTLESITHSRDFLFLTYSDGINTHLFEYNLKTEKTQEIKKPYAGTAFIFCLDNKTNNCFVVLTSWNKPITEFNFNAETDNFTPSTFNKPPVYPATYKDLQTEEVEVKGHDGVMIPLSIIYKKGIKMDGSNVCLMDSYGAYGSSMIPFFNDLENSLAVKGVVIAIPHVRGGSEKGDAWYKAGFKTTKPNTWKDFNSCAEYLIEKSYTSAKKLAGTGTSAGGILISRAITERPDLYAAAICNVGCADAIRMEFAPNGPANIPEFGTVKDSVECRALYEMDGVQHVVAGTKYPAVICVGGWNDPRVIAWEPGKFAAALQNASTSGKPVLMKVNYNNGHFTEDKSVTFANFADQFAFAMWQCGHPDFQLKK